LMICAEELIVLISTIAIALAKDLSTEQIDILSAVFVQLGDTLATISLQRGIIEECCEKNRESVGAEESEEITHKII